MNKWFWMIVLVGLVVLLAGCGGTGNAVPSANTPSATQAAGFAVDDVQRITLAEAKALLDKGEAVLYDARTKAPYRDQHAAGAINFPAARVATHFDELPTDKALIFYCT